MPLDLHFPLPFLTRVLLKATDKYSIKSLLLSAQHKLVRKHFCGDICWDYWPCLCFVALRLTLQNEIMSHDHVTVTNWIFMWEHVTVCYDVTLVRSTSKKVRWKTINFLLSLTVIYGLLFAPNETVCVTQIHFGCFSFKASTMNNLSSAHLSASDFTFRRFFG